MGSRRAFRGRCPAKRQPLQLQGELPAAMKEFGSGNIPPSRSQRRERRRPQRVDKRRRDLRCIEQGGICQDLMKIRAMRFANLLGYPT